MCVCVLNMKAYHKKFSFTYNIYIVIIVTLHFFLLIIARQYVCTLNGSHTPPEPQRWRISPVVHCKGWFHDHLGWFQNMQELSKNKPPKVTTRLGGAPRTSMDRTPLGTAGPNPLCPNTRVSELCQAPAPSSSCSDTADTRQEKEHQVG